jgi:hypothetical protein
MNNEYKEFEDRLEKELMFKSDKATKQYIKENKNNPKELEYWRDVFPNKSDFELEEYRVRWSKENPKYLKFNRLQ